MSNAESIQSGPDVQTDCLESAGPLTITAAHRALLIPVDGPVRSIELAGTVTQMQELVGGYIEAIPLPAFIDPHGKATAYVHEEGKFDPACRPNLRATDLLVPGVGVMWGDYIAGPLLICGFDAATGEHAELPAGVEKRCA